MEKIELWCGVRGKSTRRVRFVGEYLDYVDIRRADDWIELAALYRTEDGSIVVHQMRLSVTNDGIDAAEVHIIPALDAGEQQLSQHLIEIKEE